MCKVSLQLRLEDELKDMRGFAVLHPEVEVSLQLRLEDELKDNPVVSGRARC